MTSAGALLGRSLVAAAGFLVLTTGPRAEDRPPDSGRRREVCQTFEAAYRRLCPGA